MNYFIKSFWLGALLQPKCWKCALMRSPFMATFYTGILFFFLGLHSPSIFPCVWILFIAWIFGMVLSVITPKTYYKLQYDGTTLYLYFYDISTKWKINIKDIKRSYILRVIEEKDGVCRYAKAIPEVRGIDDTLAESGFLLVRLSYGDWQILGNGYNLDTNSKILGRKIANYAFVAPPKCSKLFLISGKDIRLINIVSFAKYDAIITDYKKLDYQAEHSDENNSLDKLLVCGSRGSYLLIERENHLFELLKTCSYRNRAYVYWIVTDWFILADKKNGKQSRFFLSKNRTYQKM